MLTGRRRTEDPGALGAVEWWSINAVDLSGTTVTAIAGRMLGAHLLQSNAAYRGVRSLNESGEPHLLTDGVNDQYRTTNATVIALAAADRVCTMLLGVDTPGPSSPQPTGVLQGWDGADDNVGASLRIVTATSRFRRGVTQINGAALGAGPTMYEVCFTATQVLCYRLSVLIGTYALDAAAVTPTGFTLGGLASSPVGLPSVLAWRWSAVHEGALDASQRAAYLRWHNDKGFLRD